MNFSEPSLSYYRTALKWGLDYNNALLKSAERIRRYQMEQIESAMAQSTTLSSQLEEASTQEKLLAVGSQLSGDQLQRTIAYWSGLGNTIGQNQIELLGVLQGRALDLADGLKQGLDEAPATIPEPIVSTLRMVAEVARTTLGTMPLMHNGNGSSTYQNSNSATTRRKGQQARA